MLRNRTRVYLVLGLVASLAGFSFIWKSDLAFAQALPQTAVTDVQVAGGTTLVTDTTAKLGIFPGALQGPANVVWGVFTDGFPALPKNRAILGNSYRIQISGTTLTPNYKRPLAVAIPFGSSYWIRQVWQYDIPSKTWTPLTTTLNKNKTLGQAAPTTLDGWVVVLEDRGNEEGIASWYCKAHCSAKYPKLHGTSNDYPVGSTVRVRNLENGKTVDVKIVSRWGQPAGRVIDLSWQAFAALGSSNAGLARVRVSYPIPKVLGASTAAPVSKVETIPTLPVRMTGNIPFPSIADRPFFVMDQGTGTILAQNRRDQVAPIASLTKLMTAVVFLDTKTSMQTPITYTAADQTAYAYLKVNPGETILVRDLFYSLLVGSANNAAPALARAAGLSQADFVARMNQKAAEWGMTNTHFVDVHGLDPANVSTARDVAILASHAFHEYEPIRFVTVKRDYTFTTLNTKVTHTIKTTDKVLGSGNIDSNLIVTGGKTGFLNEAKYTYALRVANKQTGSQVVIVILGSDTSAQRFSDAAAITNWAFRNFTWGA